MEDKHIRNFQELDRQRQQFVARQAAMAFVKSFGQGKRDPGPRPDHCRLFDAEFHREGIGRFKADAACYGGAVKLADEVLTWISTRDAAWRRAPASNLSQTKR